MNPLKITNKVEPIVRQLRKRLLHEGNVAEIDQRLYENAVLWVLYHRYLERFGRIVKGLGRQPAPRRFAFYI